MSEGVQPTGGSSRLEAGEAIYLFCFAHLPLPLQATDRGLDDNRALIHCVYRRVAAVCCTVALEDFCGPLAEARLGEVELIGPRALRHQEVIVGVMRHSPVLPCRFGTLFSSLVPLTAFLEAHHLSIARFLNHVSDKDEWAVKAFLDSAQAETWLRDADPGFAERGRRLTAAAPGRRYLQEKQLHADVRRQARSWARAETRRVHEELTPWGDANQSLRLPSTGGTGPECLFNSSLLVARHRTAGFLACLDRLNAEHTPRGVTLELSGPWPPYSFSPDLPHAPEALDEVPGLRHPA